MAITNQVTKQVDLPVWEWMKFAPVTTSALTVLTTARDGSDRYLYYFASNVLYKYDTWGDTWFQMSTNLAAVGTIAVQYTKNQGFIGNVLTVPTPTSLRIPSTYGNNLAGLKIQIISGTGAGQERTITAAATETIHDSGLITSASQNIVTDTLRRWKQNQYTGYTVRVNYNTGQFQFRQILYNDNANLTVYDANYDGRNFMDSPLSTLAPYGTLVTTAGSQAQYVISSQVITVDSPWTVAPDATSKFKILSGGIWWMTQNASSPFFTWYYYDLLTDNFVPKLTPTNIFGGALSTDWAIAPFSNKALPDLLTGTATSATARTLTDSGLAMTAGNYNEFYVTITGGTGLGQTRRIISNTGNTFVLASTWTITPDNTSTYKVNVGDEVIFAGNAQARLMKYYPTANVWAYGNLTDYGIALNLALTRTNKLPFGITSATRVLTGITGVNATPTVAGTGYTYGDILTVSTGGTLGRVFVENVSAIGAVLSVSLYTAGGTYTTGTGKATTGGTGSGCTIEITSVGTIGVITTSINNDINLGETVTFVGATEAAWNTSYTVIGVQSQAILEVAITATAAAASLYALGTNLLIDVTKNWTPNEHVGKLIGVQSNGLAGALTMRKIIGNTANTITFQAGVAPTVGNSRYHIQDLEAFGKDSQYLADTQLNQGYTTTGAFSSITDSTKAWFPGSYNNNKIEVINPDGTRIEEIVTYNTATVLSLGRTVAVGAATNTLAYSDDYGLTYTGLGATIFSTQGNGVAWSGTRFVAVGQGTNTLAYSNDGVTWFGLGVGIFSTAGTSVCWNGNKFVATGNGTNTLAYSFDGITWVALGATIFTTQGRGVAWNGTRFSAVGIGTNTIAYSLDGVTWTAGGATIFTTGGYGICWAGTQFIAVGAGTNTIATSADGITFTGQGTTIFSTLGNSVTWNGTTTVAVGSGTNTIAYSSNNGTSWTGAGLTIFTTQGNGVFWNGKYFVAGGQGTNTIAYSANGSSWTPLGTTTFTTFSGGGGSTSPGQSTLPAISFTPATNSFYKLNDTYGTANAGSTNTALIDYNKKWKVNQWAGKRVIVTSGTGITQEFSVTSNTANTLSFGAIGIALDFSTTYTIIGRPSIGAGISLIWNFESSDTTSKGKYLFCPRGGGSPTYDRYDTTKNIWLYGQFILAQGELLTTGSMYAYDGDRIYYQINATGRLVYYDIVKNVVEGFGYVPYGMGAAVLANRMEIITTADGLKYLYLMRHTGTEMWRTLIFF